MTARRLSPAQCNMLHTICNGQRVDRTQMSFKAVQTLDSLRQRGYVDSQDCPTEEGRAVFAPVGQTNDVALLKFYITPPGHAPYTGNFPGNREAIADAEQRFPDAPPASVINLHFTSGHVDFLRTPSARYFLTLDQPELTDAGVQQYRAHLNAPITPAQEAR